MSKVSVIITAYNSECYIKEAIESALSQTYEDIEIIIVDDNSTDRTKDVIESFGSKIRYIRHTENLGLPMARNRGIREAKGEYIAFLDHDDVWLQTKIKEQIELFKSNKDVALVYSNCYKIDQSGNEIGLLFDRAKLHKGAVFEKLLLDNFIVASTVLVKSQVIKEVGLYDSRFHLSLDFDLCLRIAERYKIDFIGRPLVKYRIHRDAASNKKRNLMLEEAISISRFYRDKINSRNPDLVCKLDKMIAKYMFYIAIWSLEHRERREAMKQYLDCIKTMAFDWKIAWGFMFFIMPAFVSRLFYKRV